MVIAPGINCDVTVILRPGEELPRHLNKQGVLVVEEIPETKKWKVIKTPYGFLDKDKI